MSGLVAKAVDSTSAIGCQGSAFNTGEVGTKENPLQKSGELTENEVWAGKIQVVGDVIVPEGKTLTIRSDSVVGLDSETGTHQLIVRGSLYAEGKPDRMIIFGLTWIRDQNAQNRRLDRHPI